MWRFWLVFWERQDPKIPKMAKSFEEKKLERGNTLRTLVLPRLKCGIHTLDYLINVQPLLNVHRVIYPRGPYHARACARLLSRQTRVDYGDDLAWRIWAHLLRSIWGAKKQSDFYSRRCPSFRQRSYQGFRYLGLGNNFSTFTLFALRLSDFSSFVFPWIWGVECICINLKLLGNYQIEAIRTEISWKLLEIRHLSGFRMGHRNC